VAQPGAAPRVISPDIPDNYRTRVFGQWPIYTAGRTDALERAALAEARASGADLESLRADLRLETTQTYWALSTAVESVRVLERALERADAHLRDVRSQLDAGLIPPNEVLNVQTERSRQEVQLIEARNRRMVLALDLARLVDLSPETRIEPVDRLEGTVSLPASGQITRPIPEGVLNGRPERRALILRLAGAEERERAAAAAVRPTVSLSGGVDYARPNTRIFPIAREWRTSWDLGVTVLWTAWDFGRARAEIAEVSAGASAARARLSELDEIIATELRARALDLESSVAAVRAAEEGVRSAVEAERVVTERFNVGVATTTDRLDAQVFVLQAELDRTRALANVRLAEARLERARGQ
jgi:outer membrane protein TolC